MRHCEERSDVASSMFSIVAWGSPRPSTVLSSSPSLRARSLRVEDRTRDDALLISTILVRHSIFDIQFFRFCHH